MMVIEPYRSNFTWVFDDESVDLVAEPFVFGMPQMIDYMIKHKSDMEYDEACDGFGMIFSKSPFPDYHMKIDWVKEDSGGNWYYSEDMDRRGWLCPALFKYFDEAPESIYIMALRRDHNED